MRKTIFLGLLLSVIAITFYACTKDESRDEPILMGRYSINATAEPQEEANSSETRTALQGAQVEWSTGDQIMVVRKGHPETAEYRLSSVAGSRAATFVSSTLLPEGTTLCGLYPYDPSVTYINNVFNFTLSPVQVYARETFGNRANPMVAQSDEQGVLQFSNLCGVIKLQLRGDEMVGYIEMTTTGEKVSGPVSVDTNTEERLLVTGDATDASMRKLTLLGINENLSPDAPTSFYFVVPAQTYAAGVKFTAYDASGAEITYKETTKPLVVNKSRVLPLVSKKLSYFPDVNFRTKHLPALFPSVTIYRLPNGDIDMDDPRNKPLVDAMATRTTITLNPNDGSVQTLKGLEYFPALGFLDCHNMQVKELDVTRNKMLKTLYCYNNQLTRLDLSNNTDLSRLSCGENQLTTLDLSNNPNLANLSCYKNRLTELTITYLPLLRTAYCGSHTSDGTTPQNMALFLTEAQLNDRNIAGTGNDANLRIIKYRLNFPDPIFREILIQKYDLRPFGDDIDMNDKYNIEKFNTIEELNLDFVVSGTDRKIKTLAGIENFKALKVLSVPNHEITALDVNQNPQLTKLNVNGNKLLKLTFDVCTQLWKLDCRNNRLRTLKFPVASALTTLDCSNNQLDIPIDFAHATKLIEFHCGNNNMHTLDISPCTSIKTLSCERNLLTDIRGLEALSLLQDFNCSENQLTNFSLQNKPNLTYLNCSGNPLSGNFSFAGATQLGTLCCASCNLSTLNLNTLSTSCVLCNLDCSHNQLTKLDLTRFYKSYSRLNLSHNLLTSFDLLPSNISNEELLPNLKYIDISNNKMNMKDENLFDWKNWKGTVKTDLPKEEQGTPKDEEAKKGYYFMRMPNLKTLHCYENDKIKRIFIKDKAPKLKDLRIGLQHLAMGPYQNNLTICHMDFDTSSMYEKIESWVDRTLWPENKDAISSIWDVEHDIYPHEYVEP
ncbi:MAG: hypothetical protein RR221_07065 [Alistipes sp.]